MNYRGLTGLTVSIVAVVLYHSPPTPWAKESVTAAAHGNTER